MSQEGWIESRCSNTTAHDAPEIARPRQLAHPIGRGLGAEHDVPDSRGHPENRVRLARMMRQMARAQPRFDARGRDSEMNPVVNVLIDGESAYDSAIKNHPGRETEPRKRACQQHRRRNPRAQRK